MKQWYSKHRNTVESVVCTTIYLALLVVLVLAVGDIIINQPYGGA